MKFNNSNSNSKENFNKDNVIFNFNKNTGTENNGTEYTVTEDISTVETFSLNKNGDASILKGRVFKFGDDISTDLIAPGRYFHLRSNLPELAKHVLEDADPDFANKVKTGDFIAAGRNFGLGSSREHAPTIIKIAGIRAVLAQSFARIFFRNAINIGLVALICDTSKIDNLDILEIDLKQGHINNLTKNIQIQFNPLPDVMIKILNDGGLVNHITKYKGFNL